jgi:hypothetical protein
MSFIPGSGAGVVRVLGGQGISASGTAAVTVSANLTAGPGIVLGAGPGGSVQITAAGPSGNVTAVGTSNGAGITTSFNSGTGVVTLDRGLFNPAGTGSGILLTESTSNAELYISNAQSVDSLKGSGAGSSNGTGITVTPYVSGVNKTFGVSANLVGGNGISIAPTSGLPGNTGLTIANTGIVGLTAGNGINLTAGSAPIISNTGVTALTAGSGISLSGSTGNVTISSTAGPGTITIATLTSGTSYTVPGDATQRYDIDYTIVGAGGGGGYGCTNGTSGTGGGGGASGAIVQGSTAYPVLGGTVLTYSIGAGGVPVATFNTQATSGGSTTLTIPTEGVTKTAVGGAGGFTSTPLLGGGGGSGTYGGGGGGAFTGNPGVGGTGTVISGQSGGINPPTGGNGGAGGAGGIGLSTVYSGGGGGGGPGGGFGGNAEGSGGVNGGNGSLGGGGGGGGGFQQTPFVLGGLGGTGGSGVIYLILTRLV